MKPFADTGKKLQDICIFAHYDRDGIVDPYVFRYIESLKSCNFAVILVSTVEISPSNLERLKGLCVDVIVRENIGHDFGSWSVGLQHHRQHIRGRLLLANDSVYGPIGDLNLAINTLVSIKADFYGMVESAEHITHLQSWFLLFESNVVHSEAFAELFCQPPEERLKDDIIRHYELRVTDFLVENGFSYRALHSHGTRSIKYNPTAYLWRELIEDDHIPFLKVAIVRDDPVGNLGWSQWRPVIERAAPDLAPLIENHLARTRINSRLIVPYSQKVARCILSHFIRMDDYFARRGAVAMCAIIKKLFDLVWWTYIVTTRILAWGRRFLFFVRWWR